MSSNAGVVSRSTGRETRSKTDPTSANANVKNDPVEDFLVMECDVAGKNCGFVDSSLADIKKVCSIMLFLAYCFTVYLFCCRFCLVLGC